MLERQNYRLTYWRAADRELDYRRFFDINTLMALRVHDPRVFADTHALILRWLDGGRARRRAHRPYRRIARSGPVPAPLARARPRGEDLGREDPGARRTRADRWPVAGTTGYDFLNIAGGLFVDPAAEEPLSECYSEFIAASVGKGTDYTEIARENKLRMLRESLGSDVNRLTALLLDLCQQHWPARDFTRHELQEALREVVADFPVYRTYIRSRGGP